MKKRAVASVIMLVLLCGCTDAGWDDALNYAGFGETPDAPPQPVRPVEAAPSQAASQDNARQAWCQSVAGSDVIKAQSDGFTPDTVNRMAVTSYSQCMTMSGVGR